MNILLFNPSPRRLSITFFCCLCLLVSSSYAQYYPNYTIPVYQGSKLLPMPWVGGLNNPQFSAADLNNDGVKDLVIFDRTGNKFLTFINNNIHDSVSYTYAPQYEANFPVIQDWALLIDYNHDNIPDLWAHTLLGIQVYNGYYNSKNELCFNLYTPLIYYNTLNSGYANLPVTSVDIPSFIDMDNDGDIDVLTWDELGGYLNLYTNQSMETGHGTDSLSFILTDNCWGDIYEETNLETKDLYQHCPWARVHLTGKDTAANKPVRHSGHVTCAFENNIVNHQDKDVIIGNLGFNDLVYIYNHSGTFDSAYITYQDTTFPHLTTPALMTSFPGAFYLDLNNDSLNDIIAAPNQMGGATDIANVWYYQNVGTPDSGIFVYKTDSLFTKDMIDVGEGAAPVFAKLNNDSLNDLIVGNFLSYGVNNPNPSQLAYYKNIGTTKNPVFTLVTKDYMGLSKLNLTGLYPAFGDLDGDGDLDMVLGNNNGTLMYYENTAGAGNPANFVLRDANYFKIEEGNFSTPQLVDVNGDGLLDLLIGNQTGTISYYQNFGTAASPLFKTVTDSPFGGVNVQDYFNFYGYSVPFLTHLNKSDSLTLLVGCAAGTIYQYNNIDNNLRGNFTRVDSAYAFINTGSSSTICGADLNDDGIPELVIGNYRGGVTIYDTSTTQSLKTTTGIIPVNYAPSTTRIYPNPTSGTFTLQIVNQNEDSNPLITITSMLGQQMAFKMSNAGNRNKFTIQLNNCPSGIYFCTVYSGGQVMTTKIIVGK